MRKTFLILAGLIFSLGAAYAVHAQIATTMISFGMNTQLTANAEQYLAIPSCSKAAGCMASFKLCNELEGKADSTHCINVAANGQAPYNSNLWIGIEQTVKTSTGTSTTPYGFGTVTVSVWNNELKIVP